MKKIVSVLMAAVLVLSIASVCFAQDNGNPKIMVTDYTSSKVLSAGQKAQISITFSNMSKTQEVKNIKLKFNDESGKIIPVGVTSKYVDSLKPKESVTWTLNVNILSSASSGYYPVAVSSQYSNAEQIVENTDIINLNIKGKATLEDTKPDNSKPYLMVIGYSVDGGSIKPGENKNVNVILKNMSSSKSINNIKLSISEETKELKTKGMSSTFVKSIAAGATYTWKIPMTAIYNAKVGEHTLALSAAYEDKNGESYEASDMLYVDVRQTVKINFDSVSLPPKSRQEEIISISLNVMNTGKSNIYNCIAQADVDGLLSEGSALIGEIPVGESKSGNINLKVDSKKLGETSGLVLITYEDDYGQTYKEEVPVSTIIDKKVKTEQETQKSEEKKNNLWWAFAIGGLVVGGCVGASVPIYVYSRKRRKEDELRL